MTERQNIEHAINTLKAQRGTLPDAVIETSITILQQQLTTLKEQAQFESALKGERKYVTIMFADISGFTTMSETMDPEAVRRIINACFQRLADVITQYGGHIDKYIGDAVMALFGAPAAHENDPERALRAALDMMMALEQFNLEYESQLSHPLALHFGLNSGLVIAGGIGAGQRQDYSVIGDTVNLAARLEDLSAAGEILISEETYRRTAPLFDFEVMEPVVVKGKAQPVRVYRLLRAKAVHGGQIRGIEGLVSPLVGRANELTVLTGMLQKFLQGQGNVVRITGEAGIGKSRLVQELRQKIQAETHDKPINWAEGHAISYGQNAAYLMARDMLGHVLDLNMDAPPEETEQNLRNQIERLLPHQMDNTFPYLALLLDLPLDDQAEQRIKYLPGDGLQQHIRGATQAFIRAKTKETPLVMVWEDMHWADPSSLDLLESLLSLTQDCPLLIFLVYRPASEVAGQEFYQHLANSPYPVMDLPPLTPAESGQLLTNLLGQDALPDTLYKLIIEKTEGNPFYVEEVVRSLIEGGVITYNPDGSGYTTTAPNLNQLTIPGTLQGVIMARIDRLTPQAKRLLQVASVIGRNFSYNVLARLVDDVADPLKDLEAAGLLVETQYAPHVEYSFQHIFSRESVYNSLLHSDCHQLHQQIGETLEEIHAAELTEGDIPLILAHHFEQSQDKARALKYLTQAAANAGAAYANQEARLLYSRALALFEEQDVDAQRWRILAGQEQIFNRLGERQRQAINLTLMQTLGALLKNDSFLATTHNRRSHYFDRISEYQAAVEAAEAGLRAARRSGSPHLEAESLNLLALAAWRRFDYPEVQRWATQALHALMVVGDPAIRINSLFHLGRASYRLGQYNLALQYIEAAQDLARELDNRDDEATSHLILGWIYQRLGHYQRAEEQFLTKLEIRRAIGHRYGEATALSHLGWLASDQGQPEAGLDYCQQALDMSRAISDRENEAYALSGLGLNHAQLGHLDEAAKNYKAALTIQQEIGAATLVIFDQAELARLSLAQEDLDEARQTITPVSEWILAGNAQKFWDPWRIYQTTYQVLTAVNETDTARTILNEARTLLQQRAKEISDPQLSQCFLETVQVNKEIEQAWQALQ